MSFQQGLSGLNSSSKQLDTIGNNVANASTVGFKQSGDSRFIQGCSSEQGPNVGIDDLCHDNSPIKLSRFCFWLGCRSLWFA